MRQVTLVKGLVTEQVLASSDFVEVRMFGNDATNLRDGSFAEPIEMEVERTFLPIHSFFENCQGVRKEAYIAYTDEVKELLGVPFDIMKSKMEQYQGQYYKTKDLLKSCECKLKLEKLDLLEKCSRIDAANRMSFVDRVKFLFGAKKI